MGTARSMTGFGRSEAEKDGRRYTVEVRTVNHRFLDISIKMPKILSKFEASVRGVMKEYIERGKADVFISFYNASGETECVHYNKSIAAEYLSFLKEMSEDFGLDNDVRVSHLSRFPDVFTTEESELDEDLIWKEFEPVLRAALSETRLSREREGENLKADILSKLQDMRKEVSLIEERAPEIVRNYRNKLLERVREMLYDSSIDDSRIVTEVTIFSDKVCVDEEITRLKSHIDAMSSDLEKGGGIGRRLDFIAQEMNREANTILSKATDIIIGDTAIELKTGIEKIREQIQNIE